MKYGDVQTLYGAGHISGERRHSRRMVVDDITPLQSTKLLNANAFLVLTLVFTLAGCATKPAVLGERIGGRSYQYVAFSPDGRSLAASRIRVGWWGSLANDCIVFDLASRTERWRFRPDQKSNARALVGLTYAPDGRLLAAYWGENSVQVWDASKSNLVSRLALSNAPL